MKIALQLGPGERATYRRIAEAIREEVLRRRFAPGQRLPGARTLAGDLGVHRNTVTAAYRQLEAEGWVELREAQGTFVSLDVDPGPRRDAASGSPGERPGYDLGRPLAERQSGSASVPFRLSGGLPDLRLAPKDVVARAYRRVLARSGDRLLDYGETRGYEPLRRGLARMLADTRGLVAGPEHILVTKGSQMAIYLIARALVQPGDVVAVEGYGYQPAFQAFQRAGAKLVPLGIDGSGAKIDQLAELVETQPIRAVYLTPHHQYPTMATLSAPRRMELLRLAKRHRFLVVEDDYDHEFHYAGEPILPLSSRDTSGCVVYVGTLSKVFAPGLRVGYLVAPRAVVDRCAAYRSTLDHHGDALVEAALQDLLDEGELQRHIRRMRRIYRARRDVLIEALGRELPGVLRFGVPAGGMSLWTEVEGGVNVDRWAERALERGVEVAPARRFTFDRRSRQALRLGFAAADESEIEEGVRRLAKSLPGSR